MQQHECYSSTTNWLLLSLPAQEFLRSSALLRREPLQAKTYLEQSGRPSSKVYFIEAGVVGNLETGDVREPIEVGVIGREGIVGTSPIAGLTPQRDSLVQVSGHALVLDSAAIDDFLSAAPSFRGYLFRYIQAQLVQISLAASAGVRANVQQRLARKLLMYHDRVGSDELALTHENISLMLGVRRASVTVSIHNLEGEGFIAAHRGVIVIRDRAGLEQYCGRFYGVAESRYAQIVGGGYMPAPCKAAAPNITA